MSIVAVHGPTMLGPGGGGGTPPPVGTNPAIASISPTSVVAGALATITVTGTDFQPDADVEFDQVAGTTTYTSATSLTGAFTPAAAGTVQVTVRNDSLAAESNNMALTVTAVVVEDVDTGLSFDPAEYTVGEIEDFINDNPDQAFDVLAAEKAGKARKSLITFLEGVATVE